MVKIDGEQTIEFDGFVMDNGEVLISDSDSIGDWGKTKVHITPSMFKFWLEQNERMVSNLCNVSVYSNYQMGE